MDKLANLCYHKNMKHGELVKITWVDASNIGEWVEAEEIHRKLDKDDADIFYTVGFLVRETKKNISVAQTVCYNNKKLELVSEIMTIPKGWVKKTKVLSKGE